MKVKIQTKQNMTEEHWFENPILPNGRLSFSIPPFHSNIHGLCLFLRKGETVMKAPVIPELGYNARNLAADGFWFEYKATDKEYEIEVLVQ